MSRRPNAGVSVNGCQPHDRNLSALQIASEQV